MRGKLSRHSRAHPAEKINAYFGSLPMIRGECCSVLRLDRRTGQIATVFAPGARYRYTWETPLLFSPRDPKTMYLGMQYVLRTSDGAQTWTEISPDLTAKNPSEKAVGVITTIAPS